MTFVVALASDDLVALSRVLVLGVSGFAFAHRSTSLDDASFGSGASHDVARIQTRSFAEDVDLTNEIAGAIFVFTASYFRLTTALRIVGVAKVSVRTHARLMMIVGHAESIGTALGAAVSIGASLYSVRGRDTNLVVTAIRAFATR